MTKEEIETHFNRLNKFCNNYRVERLGLSASQKKKKEYAQTQMNLVKYETRNYIIDNGIYEFLNPESSPTSIAYAFEDFTRDDYFYSDTKRYVDELEKRLQKS